MLCYVMPNSEYVFSTPKTCSNYYARLRRVPLAKESACAPMCFEFVLLSNESNMSGDDLRKTLGNAINRIARISNDELGQILAVNPE